MLSKVSSNLDFSGRRRPLTGPWRFVAAAIALTLSLYQLYFSTFGLLDTVSFRSGHLMLAMALVFALYPARKGAQSNRFTLLDGLLATLGFAVGFYLVTEWREIAFRVGWPTTEDIVFGIAAVLLSLEIARRTVGLALPIVASTFLAYSFLGPYMPGPLAHVGFPLERLVSQIYTSTEGIYGLPLGVMVNFVFLFMLFAAFLHQSGAGRFFIDLAYALTGRFRGGPAKTAVVASGMMGMISGAATANVVTTGSFTIPMMKKLGYTREQAGGIEVAASVGGQLTPPIMGAGAFIMAEWTNTPYSHIVTIAIVPAVMYYLSIMIYAHIWALKLDIKPAVDEDIPRLGDVLRRGFHFLVPLVVLVGALMWGFTPMTSAIYGMIAMVAASWLRRETRMSPATILQALINGSFNAVTVTGCLVCAGIIMSVIGLTGVGLKFSSMVVAVAGDNVAIAIVLVAVASLFLGMELPIAAAYIMVAVLAVPALVGMGVPLITAHMVVFWFSMDAAVTPPVCITAYVAAGISGGSPMKTGLQAWKMAKALYIIPFLMVYTDLLSGDFTAALIVAVPGVCAMVCFNAGWEGHLLRRLFAVERIALLVPCGLMLYPDYYSYAAGFAGFGLLMLVQNLIPGPNAVTSGKDTATNV
jgi:TRAP transporter 4TM/12TM fusion protein